MNQDIIQFDPSKRTISLSFNSQQTAQLNQMVEDFQKYSDQKFGFVKDLVFAIISNENILRNSNNSDEIQNHSDELQLKCTELQAENNRLKAQIQESSVGYQETIAEFQNKLAAFENQELVQNESFDVAFNLQDNEKNIVQLVINNRFELLKQKGNSVPETPSELLHKAFFNRATLYNWSGEFYTGLD